MSTHRIAVSVFTLLLAFAGFTLQQAQAHARLINQSPAAGAVITAAPQTLTLNFTEGIKPGLSGLTLIGPNNSQIALGTPKIDPANPAQMIVPIEKPLASGTYQVQWHAVSQDSHKTQGNYAFSVK